MQNHVDMAGIFTPDIPRFSKGLLHSLPLEVLAASSPQLRACVAQLDPKNQAKIGGCWKSKVHRKGSEFDERLLPFPQITVTQ